MQTWRLLSGSRELLVPLPCSKIARRTINLKSCSTNLRILVSVIAKMASSLPLLLSLSRSVPSTTHFPSSLFNFPSSDVERHTETPICAKVKLKNSHYLISKTVPVLFNWAAYVNSLLHLHECSLFWPAGCYRKTLIKNWYFVKNIHLMSYSAPRDLSSGFILFFFIMKDILDNRIRASWWTSATKSYLPRKPNLACLGHTNSFINFSRTMCAKQTGLASAKNCVPGPWRLVLLLWWSHIPKS